MFTSLKRGSDDTPLRTLVILTKSQEGAVACLNLLLMAGLARHFSAIWAMGENNGVYDDNGEWKKFSPPFRDVNQHKADVLQSVCQTPQDWLPQWQEGSGALPSVPRSVQEIVL